MTPADEIATKRERVIARERKIGFNIGTLLFSIAINGLREAESTLYIDRSFFGIYAGFGLSAV